jgi:hypothetical protein
MGITEFIWIQVSTTVLFVGWLVYAGRKAKCL